MKNGELFMIEQDMEEQNNIAEENPDMVTLLDSLIQEFQKMRPDIEVGMQSEDWMPPENWTILI